MKLIRKVSRRECDEEIKTVKWLHILRAATLYPPVTKIFVFLIDEHFELFTDNQLSFAAFSPLSNISCDSGVSGMMEQAGRSPIENDFNAFLNPIESSNNGLSFNANDPLQNALLNGNDDLVFFNKFKGPTVIVKLTACFLSFKRLIIFYFFRRCSRISASLPGRIFHSTRGTRTTPAA